VIFPLDSVKLATSFIFFMAHCQFLHKSHVLFLIGTHRVEDGCLHHVLKAIWFFDRIDDCI
jgi:hypothetical protein